MQGVILAAGRGTMLYPYTKGIPKPLVPIQFEKGKITVVVERLIRQLKIAGVTELVVVVNYKKDAIIDYLGAGSRYGVRICYHFQEDLNGDAGALFGCSYLLDGDFIVLDADDYYEDDMTIKDLVEFYNSKKASMAIATVKVKEIKNYAIANLNQDGDVLNIVEKPSEESKWDNLAKLGIYVMNKDILKEGIEIAHVSNNSYSMTQLIKYLVTNKKPVKAMVVDQYFTDIGNWNNYQELFDKIHSKNEE